MNILFNENVKLISYIIKKLNISKSRQDYDDIFQEGAIGLLKACNTFDKHKKIKFSSYACKCIKNEIYKYFRKETSINISCLSLNYETDNFDGTLEDTIIDDSKPFSEIYDHNYLINKFNTLNFKYKNILIEHLKGESLRKLGKKYNVSPQTINNYLQKAYNILKEKYKDEMR